MSNPELALVVAAHDRMRSHLAEWLMHEMTSTSTETDGPLHGVHAGAGANKRPGPAAADSGSSAAGWRNMVFVPRY
eukprot:2061493-Prymnesium_polylepis.1